MSSATRIRGGVAPTPTRGRFSAGKTRAIGTRLLLWVGVVFFLVVTSFPVYWMALTALKQNADLYDVNNFRLWFNAPPTLDHLNYLFSQTEFLTWFANSYIIAALVVVITLVCAIPAGYGLARLQLRGADTIAIGIFLTYLVPPSLLFLPLSRVVSLLGLQDSDWGLVLIYPTLTIPFCTWLIRGFFKTIPKEIEEAAVVDGCTTFQVVWRIVLPLSRAGIFSVMIFAFTLSMQDFIYMLSIISSTSLKPLTLGIVTDLIRGDIFFWGELLAGALLAGLPVAIIYNFFLDDFIAGLTSGAVK